MGKNKCTIAAMRLGTEVRFLIDIDREFLSLEEVNDARKQTCGAIKEAAIQLAELGCDDIMAIESNLHDIREICDYHCNFGELADKLGSMYGEDIFWRD